VVKIRIMSWDLIRWLGFDSLDLDLGCWDLDMEKMGFGFRSWVSDYEC